MPVDQPASAISAMACRRRPTSSAKDFLRAKITVDAPTARAAINAPSTTWKGLLRKMVRSLNVPGSPSAPLTTTVVASTGDAFSATVRHLVPVGKPAPPRPRSPDASTSLMSAAGSTLRAASSPCPPPRVRYSSRSAIGCGKRTRCTMVMYAVFPFRGLAVNRWCPSCRTAWPAARAVCPDCLGELVDDPDATVRCRHCGRDWPATMASCPNCLAEQRPDPEVALEAMGRTLAMGGHLPRAAGTVPFAGGPACTLLRLAGRGLLVYVGSDGLIQAAVAGSDGRAVPPLACNDAGDVLFRLLPYEPVEAAVVAVGAALATFLRSGAGVDVR